jgi:hypothetical protein
MGADGYPLLFLVVQYKRPPFYLTYFLTSCDTMYEPIVEYV